MNIERWWWNDTNETLIIRCQETFLSCQCSECDFSIHTYSSQLKTHTGMQTFSIEMQITVTPIHLRLNVHLSTHSDIVKCIMWKYVRIHKIPIHRTPYFAYYWMSHQFICYAADWRAARQTYLIIMCVHEKNWFSASIVCSVMFIFIHSVHLQISWIPIR